MYEKEPTPFGGKFKATYSDGRIYTKDCDGNTTLRTSDTNPSGYRFTEMTEAIIGDCVTTISERAFILFQSLTSVTIGNSVQTIGNYAFQYCSGLTSIVIPDSVTSISYYAFSSCSSLTSVIIGSGITSIGAEALANCGSLTSITINATTPPTLGDSGVFNNTNNCPIYVPCESVDAYKTAWSAYASRIQCVPQPFEGKYKLTLSDTSVITGACDSTSAVTREELVAYQSNVVRAEIGECVSTIGQSAFYYCSGLTDVTIPDSVTLINNFVFNGCSGLTSVTIGNSVSTIGQASFEYCNALTDLTFPDSVQRINCYAVYQSTGLTSVTIGSGITIIEDDAFAGCISLQSITIKATTPPQLRHTGTKYYTFDDTNNCPIYVPSASVDAYKSSWLRYSSRIYPIP